MDYEYSNGEGAIFTGLSTVATTTNEDGKVLKTAKTHLDSIQFNDTLDVTTTYRTKGDGQKYKSTRETFDIGSGALTKQYLASCPDCRRPAG